MPERAVKIFRRVPQELRLLVCIGLGLEPPIPQEERESYLQRIRTSVDQTMLGEALKLKQSLVKGKRETIYRERPRTTKIKSRQ